MTTDSGLWTDPLDSAYYPVGKRPMAANVNSFVGGLYDIDQALTVAGVHNYRTYILGFVNSAVTIGGYHDHTVFVSGSGGSPVVNVYSAARFATPSMPSTVLTELLDVAEDSGSAGTGGGGNVVAGGIATGSTAQLVLLSTDRATTWTTQNLSVSSDHDVQGLTYFDGAFVAVTGNGTGAGRIETSTDGITWTARTNPLANTDWYSSKNGGLAISPTACCLTPQGSHNTLVRSTAYATWASVTMPATTDWIGSAYTDRYGWVAYDASAATIAESTVASDGAVWTAAATATIPSGATSIKSIQALANVLIMIWSDATFEYESLSVDGGATWEVVANLQNGFASTVAGGVATRGRYIMLMPSSSTISKRMTI